MQLPAQSPAPALNFVSAPIGHGITGAAPTDLCR